jgi:hypothetical protein
MSPRLQLTNRYIDEITEYFQGLLDILVKR